MALTGGMRCVVAALYEEFAMHPELREGMMASIVGYSPDVVACARHLYDHNYDVTFALEHILQVWGGGWWWGGTLFPHAK